MKKKIGKLIEKILCVVLLLGSALWIVCAVLNVILIFRGPYTFSGVLHGIGEVIGCAFLSLVAAGLSMLLYYDLNKE